VLDATVPSWLFHSQDGFFVPRESDSKGLQNGRLWTQEPDSDLS
jgi:hypothetical protein